MLQGWIQSRRSSARVWEILAPDGSSDPGIAFQSPWTRGRRRNKLYRVTYDPRQVRTTDAPQLLDPILRAEGNLDLKEHFQARSFWNLSDFALLT